MTASYRGLNTVDTPKPSFGLRDIDLVKRDLLNHFFTRRGERVMMPEYGSNIRDYIFEPMTSQLLLDIEAEVKSVVMAEPRVEFVDMRVSSSGHLVSVDVELLFNPGEIADTLYLAFAED